MQTVSWLVYSDESECHLKMYLAEYSYKSSKWSERSSLLIYIYHFTGSVVLQSINNNPYILRYILYMVKTKVLYSAYCPTGGCTHHLLFCLLSPAKLLHSYVCPSYMNMNMSIYLFRNMKPYDRHKIKTIYGSKNAANHYIYYMWNVLHHGVSAYSARSK